MVKHCSACGSAFTPRRDYYHTCFPCWKAERDGPTPTDQWRRGYLAGHEAGYQRGLTMGRARGGLDGDLLIDVIKLTHPDKHPAERFTEANQVTAKLLELREAVRR